jgi:hypothetical protein
MWPKEHGSWAVLAAPILVGLAVAGGGPPAAVLAFAGAALGGFCLRVPLQSLFSRTPAPEAPRWAAGFSILAAAGAVPLFLYYGRWGLLAFAVPAAGMLAFNIRANLARQAFSFPNEAAGILTLCLGAPAAFYAATGRTSAEAWSAWVLSSLFFIGPVFHVKLAALQHRGAADPAMRPAIEKMGRLSIAYHAAALAAAITLADFDLSPWLALIPFGASMHKTWRRSRLAPAKVDFRRLGYQEVAYTCLFALAWMLH